MTKQMETKHSWTSQDVPQLALKYKNNQAFGTIAGDLKALLQGAITFLAGGPQRQAQQQAQPGWSDFLRNRYWFILHILLNRIMDKDWIMFDIFLLKFT